MERVENLYYKYQKIPVYFNHISAYLYDDLLC